MHLNHRLITKVLSVVLAVIGISFLVPVIVALCYKEHDACLTYAILGGLYTGLGILIFKIIPKSEVSNLSLRDGFLIVALTWIGISIIGAIPLVILGDIPSFVDAFFEMSSGFSTTGATILNDVEVLTHASLMWRSLTHWLGGMGLLVMTIALLPKLGIGGHRLMRAESTGITLDKGGFTFAQYARQLYKTYITLTVAEFVLLIIVGLSPFDSAIHTFGSIGTGGFSSYNSSIAAFGNAKVEIVIGVFMLICGINFSNIGLIFSKNIKKAFKDSELKIYLCIVAISILLIAVILAANNTYGIIDSLRYAFFQVTTTISTTGYGVADYELWPEASKAIIFLLMFIGGCAGSTAGGIKVIRVALMAKLIKRGTQRKLHPNNIIPIRLGKHYIREDVVIDTCGFLGLYVFTACISTFLLCLDNVDLITAASSVISALSNIGPGFNLVGPTCNYAFYSIPSKILLSFLMIAGRLELYTLLISLRIKKN